MAEIRVQTPDGGVARFPDGTPPDEIKAALDARFGGQQQGRQRGGAQGEGAPLEAAIRRDDAPPPQAEPFEPPTVTGPDGEEVTLSETEAQLFRAAQQAEADGDVDDARELRAELAGRLSVRDANLAERGSGLLSGFTQGIFGLGDVVRGGAMAGAGTLRDLGTPEDQDLNIGFNEGRAMARGRREALAEQQRPAQGASGIAGNLLSGRSLSRAGTAVLSRVPIPAVQRLAGTVAGSQGATARTARTAAEGAAAGGVTAAAEGGDVRDIATATATGAAAGPLGDRAMQGGSALLRMAVRRLNPDHAAIRALSRRFNVGPDEIQQRADAFEQRNNRPARLIDILEPEERSELVDVLDDTPGGARIINRAAREFEETRPERVAGAIRGNRVETTPARQTARQGRSMTRLMSEIGDTEVELGPEQAEQIMSLPRAGMTQTTRDALSQVQPEGGSLTLRDIENARRNFRRLAQTSTEDAPRLNELADFFERLGAEADDRYATGLQEFARRAQRIEGIEAGRNVMRPGRQMEFEDTFGLRRTNVPGEVAARTAGGRVGARQVLAETAEEGPQGAARVAVGLSRPGTERRVAAVAGPREAARLRGIAQDEVRSTENLRDFATQLGMGPSLARQIGDVQRAAIEGGVAGTGRASAAFLAALAGRIGAFAAGTGQRNMALARALTAPLVGEADPRTFGNAVNRLRQLGASDQQIAEALRGAAAAAGIGTESVRAEDRRRRERGEADTPFEERFPELTEPLDIGVTDDGEFVPFDEAFPEPE